MKYFKLFFLLLFVFVLTGCNSKITVTFVNSVTNEVIEVIETKKGEVVKYPNSPTIEGYEFIGWDKELNSFDVDTTVTAHYEIYKYVVKFYHNNVLIDTQIVEYGGKATGPTEINSPTGKYFAGWDKDISCVKEDLIVNSVFNDLEFTVKFLDNDGNVISEQKILYGKKATEPKAPNIPDYEFIGWDKSFNNIKENLEIKAIYQLLTFEVTFLDKYGDVLKVDEVRPGGSATAPEDVNLDYYEFIGWDKEFTNVTEDLTVTATYQTKKETLKMENVEYWLQILSDKYNINKEILTEKQINNYNKNIISGYSATKVVDILSSNDTILGSKVKSLINGYSNINKYTIYNNDTLATLSSADKNTILQNRNLNAIPTNVTLKYGIITNFAWMRSYPTNHYSNSYSRDMFQETGLNVGEGVLIYHISIDGNWYFVQAENYAGWVEKKHIALCSKEELIEMLQPDEKIVVLEKYINIDNACVRMGQYFPYVSEDNNNYIIKFPTRNNDGLLDIKEISLTKNYKLSVGFLKYTYKNVYKLAFELLGVDYSWGDKESDGWDCSSTQNAIYSCFGFMMPRNTGNQKSIPTYGINHSGVNDNLMKQNYLPGTLIFSSGHVMMYIGEDLNGVSYLFHNTSAGSSKCILQSLSSYGGSKIIGVLKMQ